MWHHKDNKAGPHSGTPRRRRGQNAVEFALILPVVMSMLMATIDYGWYFARQGEVLQAVATAVRSGGSVEPHFSEGELSCRDCLKIVERQTIENLDAIGLPVRRSEVRPILECIGGQAAISLTVTVETEPLVGYVVVPDEVVVSVVTAAENVEGC